MGFYINIINRALVQFPIVAFLLTLPYMFYCYRKYGSVSLLRSLIVFSFIFYIQCAYYMVILPLPDPASLVDMPSMAPQLIPFKFVADLVRESSFSPAEPTTYITALKEMCVLQPLFNIALTIPFGIYMSYYFGKGLKQVILYSLLLSLFFEITQLTGLYGIYPKAYRLFDVDDLMLNTLGGAIGWHISVPLKALLPGKERIDQASRLRARDVSFSRRFCAYLADYAAVMGIVYCISAAFKAGSFPIYYLAAVALYFVLQPAVSGGKTLGKRLVRIRVEGPASARATLPALAARYGAREAVFLYIQSFQSIRLVVGPEYMNAFILAELAIILFCAVDFAGSFRREKRLWYEMISKTRNVSSAAG
ncbi:MAG: VanZ family protein [Clostridiales Family XIII bacterium]|jgi:glycopeptide antibiotics resistance protein|nr:VanZ family protein [Clostridiales Family XIII bacterium]